LPHHLFNRQPRLYGEANDKSRCHPGRCDGAGRQGEEEQREQYQVDRDDNGQTWVRGMGSADGRQHDDHKHGYGESEWTQRRALTPPAPGEHTRRRHNHQEEVGHCHRHAA